MIRRPIQRSVWVLLILNVLVLGVVILDWRADQVRQMSGSGEGLFLDSTREIMVARPNQNVDSASKTVQAFLEPPIDESFEAAVLPVKVAGIQSSLNVGCVLIGPFSQDESARIEALNLDIAASSWLTEGLAEQRRLIAGPEEYRVYAGPAESLNAAYQMLKDFRSQGLDSFVLTNGRLAKSVSLGVFSSYAAAERFVKTVPVAKQASLTIDSPGQADVIRYLRLEGAEADRIPVLQASGLMGASVLRKSCPEA